MRSRLVAALAFLVIVVPAGAAILAGSPPETAVSIVEAAARAFARAPAFHGTLVASSGSLFPSGEQSSPPARTLEVWHRSVPSEAYRVAWKEASQLESRAEGSFDLVTDDGVASYDAGKDAFDAGLTADHLAVEHGFARWGAPDDAWSRVCANGESRVLPDEEIAGRTARHVECGDLSGELGRAGYRFAGVGPFSLWLDAETGVLLKVLGTYPAPFQVQPDAKYEFEEIRYGAIAPDPFVASARPGALDFTAARAEALGVIGSLGPMLIEYEQTTFPDCAEDCPAGQRPVRSPGALAYRDETAARAEGDPSGTQRATGFRLTPGDRSSFSVFGNGRCSHYNAEDHVTVIEPLLPTDPAPTKASECVGTALAKFFPALRSWEDPSGTWLDWRTFSARQCEDAGKNAIVGRRVRRLRCRSGPTVGDRPRILELWRDTSSGMLLRYRQAGSFIESALAYEVKRLTFGGTFDSATFGFAPPEGARSLNDPDGDLQALRRFDIGQRAPAWTAEALDGAAVESSDLEGRRSLVLIGDCHVELQATQGCGALGALDRAHRELRGRANLVWAAQVGNAIDPLDGSEEPGSAEVMVRSVVRARGFGFPVLLDVGRGPVSQAWLHHGEGPCCPAHLAVFLDRDGRVVRATAKLLTAEEIIAELSR